jgi:hypothetical protein
MRVEQEIIMAKEPKSLPDHKDILGQPIAVGDAVVYPSSNSMCVGVVVKLNPKMVKVKRVGTKYSWEQNKYPSDLARVSGAEVTMYMLKNTR